MFADDLCLDDGGADPAAPRIDLAALRAFGSETLIRTARGCIPARDMTVDDRVVSKTGDHVPLAWIERLRLDPDFLTRHPGLRPVLICQHDLGAAPDRNVILSRRQMIWDGERYVEARHLTRHPDLFAASDLSVDYVTFQCGKPTVVHADGLWVSIVP